MKIAINTGSPGLANRIKTYVSCFSKFDEVRTIKDAEALRDATNLVLPTVRKFAEQAKRDDFTRDMASAGIKKNIDTNARLTENMQRAALNLGTTAASQAGSALTARYTY